MGCLLCLGLFCCCVLGLGDPELPWLQVTWLKQEATGWDAGKTGVGALTPCGIPSRGEVQRRGLVRWESGLEGQEECWERMAFCTRGRGRGSEQPRMPPD